MSDQSNSSNGTGFASVLFLVFLVLKLTNHIAWSWWWVTAPLWGTFALAAVIVSIGFTVALVLPRSRKKDRTRFIY
jgi:hypothetical protein